MKRWTNPRRLHKVHGIPVMPSWLIKSALHRVASLLPQRQVLNRIFQRWSRSLQITPVQFERKIDEAKKYLDAFHQLSPDAPADFTVLEVGTGWHPIIPLAFYLCGAKTVWSHDIEPLVNRERLLRTAQLFTEYADAGRLDTLLPRWKRERLDSLRTLAADPSGRSPADLLAPLGFHLRVLDAQHTGLDAGSVDLVFSSGVLMFVPKQILEGMYREFRRTAKTGAVMIHRINYRDSFSYFDHSITPLNMLRFSAAAWRWLDTAVAPQNRLRISDHREMQRVAGFRIVNEENESAPREMMQRVRLADEFRNYAEADLLVLESWIVSQPV